MIESVAYIIAQYLIENDFATWFEQNEDWPLFISFTPELSKDCISIYDTAGVSDGKLMNGIYVTHPGIQVKVRSGVYKNGWDRINEIADALDAISNVDVELNGITYRVQNLTRCSEVIFMGIEPDKRRNLFSVNYSVTVRELDSNE